MCLKSKAKCLYKKRQGKLWDETQTQRERPHGGRGRGRRARRLKPAEAGKDFLQSLRRSRSLVTRRFQTSDLRTGCCPKPPSCYGAAPANLGFLRAASGNKRKPSLLHEVVSPVRGPAEQGEWPSLLGGCAEDCEGPDGAWGRSRAGVGARPTVRPRPRRPAPAARAGPWLCSPMEGG